MRLHTGKRNQIRIQARLRGHTLVGEQRYIYGPDTLRPIRVRAARRCTRIAWLPASGDDRRLAFEAPLPRDLSELLARLRKP